MDRDIAEELRAYSRDEMGSRLRAVTCYTKSEHRPIYTRADIPEKIGLDEETRSMFRHPYMRMQKSSQELAQFHPTFESHDVSIHLFGEVLILQFPITKVDGIILVLDWEGDLPSEFISHCKSIASGSA